MRVVALDLGKRRIGVAVSDRSGTLASPHSVIARGGHRTDDHRRIAELVAEVEAEAVVVGLPLSLDGGTGPAAKQALAETDELASLLDVPVHSYDERFTTVTAEQFLGAQGVKGQDRRKVVDQVAAAVLLQTWLDGRPRSSEPRP